MAFDDCTICDNKYSHDTSPTECRTPIIGKCGHTFCRECVQKLQVSQSQSSRRNVVNLVCPSCRAKSFRGDGMVPNRALCEALQAVRGIAQQATASAPPRETLPQPQPEATRNSAMINPPAPAVAPRPPVISESSQPINGNLGESTRPKRRRIATNHYTPPVVTPRSRASAARGSRAAPKEVEAESDEAARTSTNESTHPKRRHTSTELNRTQTIMTPVRARAARRSRTAPTEAEVEVSIETAGPSTTEEDASASTTTDEGVDQVSYPVTIKTEKSVLRKQFVEHRKYGDRVLLARQNKQGMMKLGGGNCTMDLYPVEARNPNHPRFTDIGYGKAIAYNDCWQPFGPKYAGQTHAHVMCTPDWVNPFSVFMKRADFGWEYVGEYREVDPDGEIVTYTAAHSIKAIHKRKMLRDIQQSVSKTEGSWADGVESWRHRISLELENDDSLAGPIWLKEGRKPTEDENQLHPPSLAARARAIIWQLQDETGEGAHEYDDEEEERRLQPKSLEGMPATKIARIMVELDEFHETVPIEFVSYSEEIYNYVKDGPTTKNKDGKTRKNGEPCAKARDWYRKFDQLL